MARRRIHPSPAEGIGNTGSEPLHTPLDRARIIGAVLQLLRNEGLDGISMRKIADALGVKAAALYYHVKDKEQLLHLLAEEISVSIQIPDPAAAWPAQLRSWAESFRASLLRFRDAVPIMNAAHAASPNRLDHIEYLYRTLAEAGFGDERVPWLAAMLKNYIYGFVEEETRLRERAQAAQHRRDEAENNYAEQILSLPRERYPHFVRLAVFTVSMNGNEEFSFGLDVLLDGFRAQLVGERRES